MPPALLISSAASWMPWTLPMVASGELAGLVLQHADLDRVRGEGRACSEHQRPVSERGQGAPSH